MNKQEAPDPGDKSLEKEDVVFSQLTERTQPTQQDSRSLKVEYLERENKEFSLQITHLTALVEAYKSKLLSTKIGAPTNSLQANEEDD